MIIRTAALALAATVLVTPPVSARGADTLVDQADPSGDVSVFDGGGTKPTTAQRRTIDLERFTVTRTGDGVRLSYRIARVTGSRAYDQVVEMQLQRTGRDGFTLDVLANPVDRHGTAYLTGGASDVTCLVSVSASQRSDTVRVEVPGDCLPQGLGVLRVTTYTKTRNAGTEFSEDTMRVRGRVALG